jgi:hypothetical protein
MPTGELLACYIPFLNSMKLNKALNRSSWCVVDAIACILWIGSFVISTALQVLEQLPWVLLFSTVALWLAYVLYLVLDARFVFIMSGIFDKRYLRLWVIFPPIGMYFLTKGVRKYLRDNKDELSGRFDVQYK